MAGEVTTIIARFLFCVKSKISEDALHYVYFMRPAKWSSRIDDTGTDGSVTPHAERERTLRSRRLFVVKG
jgi:hypothetical protein